MIFWSRLQFQQEFVKIPINSTFISLYREITRVFFAVSQFRMIKCLLMGLSVFATAFWRSNIILGYEFHLWSDLEWFLSDEKMRWLDYGPLKTIKAECYLKWERRRVEGSKLKSVVVFSSVCELMEAFVHSFLLFLVVFHQQYFMAPYSTLLKKDLTLSRVEIRR